MRRLIVVAVMCLFGASCSGSSDQTSTTGAPPGTEVLSAATTTPTDIATTAAPTPTTTTSTTSSPSTTVAGPRPLDPPPPFDSWSAIFASLPADQYDFEQAEAIGRDIGFFQFGVLRSDDYPSLNPGYWVVFSGEWDRPWWAQDRCDRVTDTVPDCYPRYLGIDPTQPIGRSHGLALALNEDADLVALSLETGEVIRTVSYGFGGDGRYPGVPQLDGSGTKAYYSVGVEDSWFSCESSDGQLIEMDLATGKGTEFASGYSPRISPDGGSLLYLAASQCLPDPEEPGNFVITPLDTVVIRDLATGRETRHVIPAPPGRDYLDDYDLWNAAWDPSGGFYVADTDSVVWHFPTPFQGVQIATLPDGGPFAWTLIGYDMARDGLLTGRTFWNHGDPTYEYSILDPATGEFEQLDGFPGARTAGLDATGEHLIVLSATTAYLDGIEVALSEPLLLVDW